jgi:hypothetical protein
MANIFNHQLAASSNTVMQTSRVVQVKDADKSDQTNRGIYAQTRPQEEQGEERILPLDGVTESAPTPERMQPVL